MLTTEELRAEIYKRHHKRIDASDPIFMMITMNELLLASYLEQCCSMQESQMDEIRKNSLVVMDECEKIGSELINRSMTAMQQNYEAKEKAFIVSLEQASQEFLEKCQSLNSKQAINRLQQSAVYLSIAILSFWLGSLWQAAVLKQ